MANWLTSLFRRALVEPGPAPIAEPNLSVITLDRPMWGAVAAGFPRYNPDDLVRRKGLSIYAKMRVDEQVKAVCTFKRDAIISRGYSFEWPKDSALEQDERENRVRILDQIIERMPGSFVDALNIISTGREFGFSITEKIYDKVVIDGKTWVGLRGLRGRDPSTFEFITDPYGDLAYTRQLISGVIIILEDLDKFIHYVHNPEFDLYFGQSELREAYRSWFMKDTLIKYWAIYMEKLGGGTTVVSLSADSGIRPNTVEYRALQEVLSGMKASAGMLLPPGATAQVHFPQDSDSYEKALTYHDLAIAKALLVPNLLGVSSQQGSRGSYAQSQSQIESFAWTLKSDATRLEQCITEQLVHDLGDQNWADGEYPRFRFKPLSSEGLRYIVTTWAQLAQAGVVIPTEDDEARLREILEMPDRNEDSVTLQETKANLNQEFMPPPSITVDKQPQPTEVNPPKVPEPRAPVGQKTTTATRAGTGAGSPSHIAVHKPPAKGKPKLRIVAHTPSGRPRQAPAAAFTRALLRVEFAVIEHRTMGIAYEAAKKVAVLAARAVKAQLAPEVLPHLLAHPEDIGDVQMNSSDTKAIKRAFKDLLTQAWTLGQDQARKELASAGRAAKFDAIRDNASGFIESNGFRMAGNLTDGMRSIIQQELLRAIKAGDRPEDVAAEIYNRLIDKGFTTLDAVMQEEPAEVSDKVEELLGDALGTANVPAYLNTLARTNTFEALNEARYAEFTDPALSDFVLALEYSAVLDDRTTEICMALDGNVWADDNPVWDDYRPPNHYNCRSVLVPVTSADGWNGIESDPPTVEPAAGFARA